MAIGASANYQLLADEISLLDWPPRQIFVAIRAGVSPSRPPRAHAHNRRTSKASAAGISAVSRCNTPQKESRGIHVSKTTGFNANIPPFSTPRMRSPSAESTVSSDSCDSQDDLYGHFEVSRDLPSQETILKTGEIPVVDADGQETPFKSLLPAAESDRKRVLVIFVRHFFCGLCQEYIRSLVSSIGSPAQLPADTDLVIVGCGSASLIKMYIESTKCPFPIYAEPTRRLYQLLGMECTLSLGKHGPQYMQHSVATATLRSFIQAVRRISEGDALKAGDMRQVGGEFLFEIKENETHGFVEKGVGVDATWCHRMENTRDHSELDIIQRVLGLIGTDDEATAVGFTGKRPTDPARRRWTSVLVHAVTSNHGRGQHRRTMSARKAQVNSEKFSRGRLTLEERVKSEAMRCGQ